METSHIKVKESTKQQFIWATALCVISITGLTVFYIAWHLNHITDNNRLIQITKIEHQAKK